MKEHIKKRGHRRLVMSTSLKPGHYKDHKGVAKMHHHSYRSHPSSHFGNVQASERFHAKPDTIKLEMWHPFMSITTNKCDNQSFTTHPVHVNMQK